MNRTVLLVDGTNLAHRAYHALGGSGAATAEQIANLAKGMIVDWPKRLHLPHDYIVASSMPAIAAGRPSIRSTRATAPSARTN